MQVLRVVHITPSFFPATRFGGPIVSTKRLCDELVARGEIELRVETTNTSGKRFRDKLSKEAIRPAPEMGYAINYCNKWAGADWSPALLRSIASTVRDVDVVHLTGVYSWPTFPTLACCAVFDKPLVWSPRGALQVWAGSRRRRVKVIWNSLCSILLKRTRAVVHVTSQEESHAAQEALRGIETAVIRNGVDVPRELPSREWLPNGVLRVLYLGRIDQKKGIENLLRALSLLRDPRWTLVIYGAGQLEYERALRELVSVLRIESNVRFAGHVEGEKKGRAFADADLCVVPSHTENFGIVVAEALAHQVPVIASRGTPWMELESHRCGYWVDNQPESLAEAIDSIRTQNLAQLGENGRRWMESTFGWPEVARQMLDLYRKQAGQ